MGLSITAGCYTARNQTRVCSDASSTEMQCLRPLCHSGEMLEKKNVLYQKIQLNETPVLKCEYSEDADVKKNSH